MVKAIHGESEEKGEVVREVKEEDVVDVHAKTVEVSTRDPSSPISDSSCQTDVAKPISVPGRINGATRRSTKGGWTEEEDEILAGAVKKFKGKNWKKIAEFFPGRSDVQCLHRWQKVLDPELVKGAWSKEEDECIIELVNKYGPKKWAIIARKMPGRIGKQCRERWHNHLNPAIKKGAWTREEEITLIRAHQIYGNKWAEIAKFLPGRADNSIKNHWNCSVKKKLDTYLSPGLPSQLPKIVSIDLNNNPEDMESPKDDATQKVSIMIDHKPMPAVVVNTSSASLLHGGSRMPKEDSHCCKTVGQPITLESFRGSKEVPASIKPFATRHNTSPIGRDTTYFPSTEGTNCAKVQDRATNVLCKDEYNDSRALDGLIPTTPLQCKLYGFFGSTSCLQMQSHGYNTKELFESPKIFQRHAQASDILATVDTTTDLNKCSTSSLQENMLLDPDKVVNHGQTPCTPVLVDKVNLTHDSYEPIWLGTQENITKTTFFKSDNSMNGLDNRVCSSAPLKLSPGTSLYSKDPESILRNAAKSFRNMPSILRKRHQKQLGSSSVKKSCKDHADAEELYGACYSAAKVESISNASGNAYSQQGEMQTHDDRSPKRNQHARQLFLSSSAPSKSETRDAMRSVEKRLEFAFDMEWNGVNTNSPTSMLYSPLSVTFSVNNHVDISNNSQKQLSSLGQSFCYVIPETITTCD